MPVMVVSGNGILPAGASIVVPLGNARGVSPGPSSLTVGPSGNALCGSSSKLRIRPGICLTCSGIPFIPSIACIAVRSAGDNTVSVVVPITRDGSKEAGTDAGTGSVNIGGGSMDDSGGSTDCRRPGGNSCIPVQNLLAAGLGIAKSIVSLITGPRLNKSGICPAKPAPALTPLVTPSPPVSPVPIGSASPRASCSPIGLSLKTSLTSADA